PFNHLYVKKLLLSRGDVDSMIYVSEGDLSFNVNPLRLLRGELVFSGIDADSIVVRIVSNYTPQLQDTTSNRELEINFLPGKIDVDHVDFRLRDTVRHMNIIAKSGRLNGKVKSTNFKNKFSFEDIVLHQPDITVYGAKEAAGQNPYIRKLWTDFRKANGLD